MTIEESRVLGFTRRRYYPLTDIGHGELDQRLRSVVSGAALPDERTALLVELLAAGGRLGRWAPKRQTKEERARTRATSDSDLIGDQERAILSAVAVRVERASESGR